MKKSFKNALLALALIAAGTGAYATKLANAPKSTDTLYNWTRSSGDPIPGEQAPFNGKTVEEAESNYGCSGTNDVCATGTNPLNPTEVQQIRFN